MDRAVDGRDVIKIDANPRWRRERLEIGLFAPKICEIIESRAPRTASIEHTSLWLGREFQTELLVFGTLVVRLRGGDRLKCQSVLQRCPFTGNVDKVVAVLFEDDNVRVCTA